MRTPARLYAGMGSEPIVVSDADAVIDAARQGRRRRVLATNWVVESTTRYGAELGYDVTVLEDCCQGFSDELHDFAIEKTLPYYATIMKSSDFIATLD